MSELNLTQEQISEQEFYFRTQIKNLKAEDFTYNASDMGWV